MSENTGSTTPQIPTFSYTTSYGDSYTLALYRESYLREGNLALGAIIVDGPVEEELFDAWGILSVNVPDDPAAAAWCATEGNLVIDTNNQSAELVSALVESGVVSLSGETCRSGFCTYPLASVSAEALPRLKNYMETLEALEEASHENPSLDEQARDAGETSHEGSGRETSLSEEVER